MKKYAKQWRPRHYTKSQNRRLQYRWDSYGSKVKYSLDGKMFIRKARCTYEQLHNGEVSLQHGIKTGEKVRNVEGHSNCDKVGGEGNAERGLKSFEKELKIEGNPFAKSLPVDACQIPYQAINTSWQHKPYVWSRLFVAIVVLHCETEAKFHFCNDSLVYLFRSGTCLRQ